MTRAVLVGALVSAALSYGGSFARDPFDAEYDDDGDVVPQRKPREPVDHITTPEPLTKRQRRRLRGRAKP